MSIFQETVSRGPTEREPLTKDEHRIIEALFPVVSEALDALRTSSNEVNALAMVQVIHAVHEHSRQLMWFEGHKKGRAKRNQTHMYERITLARGHESSVLRTYTEIFEGRVKE